VYGLNRANIAHRQRARTVAELHPAIAATTAQTRYAFRNHCNLCGAVYRTNAAVQSCCPLASRLRQCDIRYIGTDIAQCAMSPRSADLLSSVFSVAVSDQQRTDRELSVVKTETANLESRASQRRRTMIWDLHHSTHCSIIGTCLSTAELRRVLIKVNAVGVEVANDHDLHMLGVMLAGRPEAGARVLQKTLDRRHQAYLKQFSRAKDESALTSLWEDALNRGDIPGAYWAVLTHPAATDKLVKRVFGDVHMLSHLVGAANRADIRRLKLLEQEKASLAIKVERQQRQLREGFLERDATIRRLKATLAHTIAQADRPDADAYFQTTRDAMADLERRLNSEIVRRERLEQRVQVLSDTLRSAEQDRDHANKRCKALSDELASIDNRIQRFFATDGPDLTDDLSLSGLTVLYVGGRENLMPQFRSLVARAGGVFLHHDGGMEHNPALLPGFVSRAQWVLFPVDCISHDAMGTIKRACRQSGKPYLPLRTSSLTCLFSGLVDLSKMTTPLLPEQHNG
jgi:hypothetical protein